MLALDTDEIGDYDVVITAGYHEAGGGGFGTYYYLSSSTATPDGGSVHEPDSGNGRFHILHNGFVTLKQFGAKIDGTYKWYRSQPGAVTPTDDAAAAQAAIDYCLLNGVKLEQEPGYCRIASPLTVSKGWGLQWSGKPFNYVTLGVTPGIESADKFLNSVLVRDFSSDGPLLTVRGALSTGAGTVFTTRGADDDIDDYDLSSGYRHTGSLIENIVLSTVSTPSVSITSACLLVKRIGRCTFRNLCIYKNPGRALEIMAADDSSFERCFFYVNGNTTAEKAVRLRRTVAESSTESTYTTTNTLHFQSCDWEGNNYGNFDTSPSGTDTGFPQGLYFDGSGLMKTVHAAASGVNCVSIYSVTGIQLDLAAVNMTADSAIACTEIMKLDTCTDVRGKCFMQQTGGATLLLTRYVTLVACTSVDMLIEMFSTQLAVDQFMVNADASCSQINVTGTMRFATTPHIKKLCNVLPNQVNYPGTVQIGEILDADMSVTADQLISVRAGRYKIQKILADKPSVSLAAAQGGIATGTGGSGTVLVANTQAYSALSALNKNLTLMLEAGAVDTLTDDSLWLKLGTAQGLPAAKTVNNLTGQGLVGSGTQVNIVTNVPNGFAVGNMVLVSGANEAFFNVRAKIITVFNAQQFAIALPSSIPGTPPAVHGTPNDDTSITVTLIPTCDIRIYGDVLQ